MTLPIAPPQRFDDQEFYPLHEEDDVPETPPHEARSRYARDAIEAHFPTWFVTGNVCIYWERGNTRDYRAPDVMVVKAPLTEPVVRIYQLWRQPPVAFVLEVASRSTFRIDEGPKVADYQDLVKAGEYLHVDLDQGRQRLWRLSPAGYEEAGVAVNGRLQSQELGLEFALTEEGELQIFTPEGERLLSHEEEVARRKQAEEHAAEADARVGEETRRWQAAEADRTEEARLRQEAEAARADEARLREEAEARAAELEHQLAQPRARPDDR